VKASVSAVAARAPGQVHWIDLTSRSGIEGRVRVAWDPSRPAELVVEAISEGIPLSKTAAGKFFGFLGLLGAVAAFGLWVWFAICDWSRILNRLASTFSARAENSASKLEIGWLLVGWAVGPAFVAFGASMISGWFDEQGRKLRVRRVQAFARKELDGAVAAEIQRARDESALDFGLRSELGLGS
jgi:hypothetical protein